MATTFEVNSRDHGATLRLHAYDRDHFIAELRGLNLVAQARVYSYMSTGLAEMFAEMAADWRGWPGEKSWSSLEGELHLSIVALDERAMDCSLRSLSRDSLASELGR